MRTKNLNLKKKIAFIASVAMIATSSVAYMPASAANATVTSPANTVVVGTSDKYTAAADAVVDTFVGYLKVNNKYLVYNKTTKKYSTVNSISNLASDVEAIDVVKALTFTDSNVAGDYKTSETTLGDTQKAAAGKDNFDKAVVTDGQKVELPYMTDANATYEIEFVAKKGASLRAGSQTSIEFKLDEHGMYKIPTQTKYVIGMSDNSNYDDVNKLYKVKDANVAGSYEMMDFSGLQFQMNENEKIEALKADLTETSAKAKTMKGVTSGTTPLEAELTPASGKTTKIFQTVGTNADWQTEDITFTDSYKLKKINGVYATVLTGTLDKEVYPGDSVTVESGLYRNTWSVSGVNNKGQIIMNMGDNGIAESGLISATKDGVTEYYVYVVKNPGDVLNDATNTKSSELDISFNGVAGTTTTANDHTANYNNLWVGATNAATKRYKVEKEVKAETVDSKKQFVTVYTVYNNDVTSLTGSAKQTINLATATGYINLPEVTATATANGSNWDIKKESNDLTLELTNNAAGSAADANAAKAYANGKVFQAATITTDTAGNYESPLLSYTVTGTPDKVSYFRVNFTTDYEIKINDNNKKTNPDKAYDGKVSVSGVEITQPTDAEKKGFDFESWVINVAKNAFTGGTTPAANTAYDVFNVNAGSTQLVTKGTANGLEIITPNAKLEANYKGQMYNVVLDAGDGIINKTSATTANAALSQYKMYEGSNEAATATLTNLERKTDNTDIKKYAETLGVVAEKKGFTFMGWSTDANATVAMDEEDLEDAFPGKNETLKLYAVYTANDSINFNFRELAIDSATGAILTTDGTASEVDNATDATKDAYLDNTAAEFTYSSDSMKTGVAGQKVGKLPTPIKSGYEFAGWYIKHVDKLTSLISAVKVTEDTVINNDIFDNGSESQVTLFAKFVQKECAINFDLNGGSWTDAKYDEDDSDKPVSFKYFGNEFKVYNAKGGIVYSTVAADGKAAAFAEDPQIGSGDFQEFKGWTIGTNTTKVKSSNLYNEIKKLKSAEDITIKANFAKVSASSNKTNIYLNANGGGVYYATFDKDGKPTAFFDKATRTAATVTAGVVTANDQAFRSLMSGESLTNTAQSTGSVAGIWTVDGDTLIEVANKSQGFVVARPGYTFTGWYKDAACTEAYTFGNYPALGKEDVVYAGWKANNFTRYRLNYDLFSADGTLVTNDANANATAKNGYSLARIRTAATGTIVDASKIDKLIVKEGVGTQAVEKTYVYSTKLSDKDKGAEEVKAEYKVGIKAAAAADTVAGLATGEFIEDPNEYVNIYGRFVPEGTETPEVTELGKATDVKVAADGTVTFKAADNAVKYQVCKIVNGTKYHSAKVDATSIKITPAKQDYSVYVIAFDENGKSTHSETVKVTVKSSLGVVKNPTVTESMDGDVKIGTVTWDKVEGATWYKVFKIVNGKRYWGSKVTSNTYVFKNLPKTSSYIIYVAAGDDNGNVTYSARTKISKYPEVKNVKISADKKTVTFDKAEGAFEYQVAKLINNKSYYSEKSDKNSITLKNAAKSGQQVYVLAFFKGTDGKTYSSYSKAITVE